MPRFERLSLIRFRFQHSQQLNFGIAEPTELGQQPTRQQPRVGMRRPFTEHLLTLTQRVPQAALPVQQPRELQSHFAIIRGKHHRTVQKQARF